MKKEARALIADAAFAEACPSENEVAAFASGWTTVPERERLEAHLDKCAACRSIVADIASLDLGGTASSDGTSTLATDVGRAAVRPGDVLGRYVVESWLGSGAAADVWLARDTLLQRAVALKIANSPVAAEMRARFLVEARAVARMHADLLPNAEFRAPVFSLLARFCPVNGAGRFASE